jgi:hypothetical protein
VQIQQLSSPPCGPAAAVTGPCARPSAKPRNLPSRAANSASRSPNAIGIAGKVSPHACTVPKTADPWQGGHEGSEPAYGQVAPPTRRVPFARSGPVFQKLDPNAKKLGPIFETRAVSVPRPPFPEWGVGVCTGPLFRKRQKIPEILMPLLSFSLSLLECSNLRSPLAGEIGTAKLFKTFKLCMIFLALSFFINYYA